MNTRAILFVLGLIVGAIAVFLWKKAEIENLDKTANDCAEKLKEARSLLASTASVVVVGPTADVLSDPQLTIHVDQRPVVYWKGLGAGLAIQFEAKDYPKAANGEPPFVSGTNSQSQPIRCDVDDCFSYGLNPKVASVFQEGANLPCPTPVPNHAPFNYKQCLDYKYSQTLDGKTVDGHIIIVKP